ncbi:ParB N-terminal domain-containing protein [bacterium]|nr:ParB N-terminal domain-containing protein [bacterium]
MNYKIEIVPADSLHQHEQIIPDRLAKVVDIITREQCVDIPVVVDDKSRVILDGHHRFNALIKLGAKKIPALLIDYLDDSLITVEARPESGFASLSKKEVIDMGLSDKVFRPKTTRHKLKFAVERVNVPLAELM